jgi:hypothetical protein
MDDKDRAFIQALTTEHYVLQAVASATISEAGVRASLYVYTLSSSLVAIGFASRSPGVFGVFAIAVLFIVFVLGVFTALRLIDTGIENLHALKGITRIRSYYRTLTPEAAALFSAESGRWPEGLAPPAWGGPFMSLLTTTASVIAVINSIVLGAWVTSLLMTLFDRDRIALALSFGASSGLGFAAVFLVYQRRRYDRFWRATPNEGITDVKPSASSLKQREE